MPPQDRGESKPTCRRSHENRRHSALDASANVTVSVDHAILPAYGPDAYGTFTVSDSDGSDVSVTLNVWGPGDIIVT